MHHRLTQVTAALLGLTIGLVLGGAVPGTGAVALFGAPASHDDAGPSPTTTPDADDDATSTTVPDGDDGDDDTTSTTTPDDDDDGDDTTSTTAPDDDEVDDDDGDDEDAVTSEVRTYSAADAATITVRRTGDRLEIVSIDRQEGWSQEIKHDGGDKVEVRFTGHDRRVEFRAEVDDGVISTRVRNEAD